MAKPKSKSSAKSTVSKKSSKSSKKVTKNVKKTVAAAPVKVAAAKVVTKAATTPTVAPLATAFVELLSQLTSLRSQLTSITGQVRALQKRTDRELKLAQKAGRKRARKSGNRAPSGFVKPTLISTRIVQIPSERSQGCEMARTAVTREINAYIRAHKLQDPKNGRRILPDTKLRKLLKVGKNEELTYFNLQRYMSPHFAKAGNPPAANGPAAATAH